MKIANGIGTHIVKIGTQYCFVLSAMQTKIGVDLSVCQCGCFYESTRGYRRRKKEEKKTRLDNLTALDAKGSVVEERGMMYPKHKKPSFLQKPRHVTGIVQKEEDEENNKQTNKQTSF